MSRAGTRVSRPAQRPTIASTPSAAITTRARQVSSPVTPRRRTSQRPSGSHVMPAASVLTRSSAPRATARSARNASNRVRSSIQATARPVTFTSVSSGATNTICVILRATQGAPSGSANSRSPASPTPSAQRTGTPTPASRSSNTTSSSGAARLASHAATAPAGPAPMTSTSVSWVTRRPSPTRRRGRGRCTCDSQCRQPRLPPGRRAAGESLRGDKAAGTTRTGRTPGDPPRQSRGRPAPVAWANGSRGRQGRQASALLGVTLFISLMRSRAPPSRLSLDDLVPLRWPKWTLGAWSPANEIAVDLGTANTLIYVKGEGIVLNEPSVVAIEKSTGKIKGIGLEAKRMLGRTPDGILAVRPLKDGVIADFDVTEKMLRFFLKTIIDRHLFRVKPKVIVCVPSGITEVEKRAVRDSAQSAGAKEVYMVAEPMAAAIGVGLPVETPTGNMVIDIGGGTTEIAVIALSGIVSDTSIRTGGDELDQAIVQFMRKNYNLLIGEPTAEQIKIQIGSAAPVGEEREMEVKGRDLVSGIPKIVRVHSSEIREAVQEPIQQIVDAVRRALEITPPELASDIVDRGIVMAGGGALIRGLDLLLQQETGLPIHLDEDPMTCVVRGAGRILDAPEKYRNVLTT